MFEDFLDPQLIKRFSENVKPTDTPLLSLIKRFGIASFAFELTGKKPLRLARVLIGNQVEMNEDECSAFICFETGAVTYAAGELYKADEMRYLILVFTSRYLDESKHPTVYRYD